ncbi:MAG TPA: cytochrome c3 family protein [Syntrophorhabdaceae bacterium]|nr:cytochrome c3 family protein [Syntrophorhabdaceae bacterium]
MRSDSIKIIFVLILLLILFPELTHGASVSADVCLRCHAQYKETHHDGTSCTDCHQDVKTVPHARKLEKPACSSCHKDIPATYEKSVHASSNLKCADCHNVHFPDKDKTECVFCHTTVSHRSLPSEKKHLSVLACVACHARVHEGTVDVTIAVKKGKPFTRSDVDLDNNNVVDKDEWSSLLGLIQKDTYTVDTKYASPGDAHSIKRTAVSCDTCHGEKSLFKRGVLKVSGVASFEVPVLPQLFIPKLPSVEQFKKTVHGKRGVKCADCHTSQARIDDQVCVNCHRQTYDVYKNTSHASSGATVCTDCHNPHSVTPYRELNVTERLNVCARCHQDYLKRHSWLPNAALHFNYLECSTCHSPKSTKSIVFYFGLREGTTNKALTYADLRGLFADASDITSHIDINKDRSITSQELSDFFMELKKKDKKDLAVGSSIIVTKVYHDYSSKGTRERVCATCHSEDAPFYESMYLVIPEKEGAAYVPVKGTTLGALPVSLFTDFSLLGEQKIKGRDITNFFKTRGKSRSDFMRGLGLKWIDVLGIALIGIILLAVIIHILGRIIFRR